MNQAIHKHHWFRNALIGLAVLVLGGAVLLYFLQDRAINAAFLERQLNRLLAEASDSLYSIEVDRISFSLQAGWFQAEDIALVINRAAAARLRREGRLPRNRFEASARRIRLENVGEWNLLDGEILSRGTLRLEDMAFHLRLDRSDTTASDTPEPPADAEPERPFHEDLARRLPRMRLDRVLLENSTFSLTRLRPDTTLSDTLGAITLALLNVKIDSATAVDSSRVLFSEDIQLRIEPHRRYSADNLYALDFGVLNGSSRDQTLTLESFRYATKVSKSEYLRHFGHRKGQYDIAVGPVAVQDLDYRTFLETQAVDARTITVDDLDFGYYNDLRWPPGAFRVKKMPHELFQAIATDLSIDSVRIRNGRVGYERFTEGGVRPGELVFADIQATLTNLTNDPARMTASTPALFKATTRLMGAGLLETVILLPLLSPEFDLAYGGTLGPMDVGAINPMLVNAEGMEANSGRLHRLWFDVHVDNGRASGTLKAHYEDLNIRMVHKDDGSRGLGQRLKSFVVNQVVVRSDNMPKEGEPAHVGAVAYRYKPGDTFFKTLWASLRTGLMSITGIDRIKKPPSP